MTLRWIGVVLILCSSTGLGIGAAAQVQRTRSQLRQLEDVLGILACDMRYSMSTLPSLCSSAANVTRGAVRTLFLEFSKALSQNNEPEAAMRLAIGRSHRLSLPGNIVFCLLELGQMLGQFDVDGQSSVIEQTRTRIRASLEQYDQELRQRCRSYRLLGICAGAAIVILML